MAKDQGPINLVIGYWSSALGTWPLVLGPWSPILPSRRHDLRPLPPSVRARLADDRLEEDRRARGREPEPDAELGAGGGRATGDLATDAGHRLVDLLVDPER